MAVKFDRAVLQAPEGLLATLQSLFPDFGDDELRDAVRSDDASLHMVMAEFASSFRPNALSSQQLDSLASLISCSVSVSDNLENAVGTCFLEHLHQVDREAIFMKQLPNDVRAYLRRL